MSYTREKKLKTLYLKLHEVTEKTLRNFQFKGDSIESYENLLLAIFMKNYKTLKAIYILCREGFGPEAMALYRGMLDSSLDIRYMRKDKDARAKLFTGFLYIEQYKMFKNMKTSQMFSTETEEKRDKMYQDVLRRYEEEKAKRSEAQLKNWSGFDKRKLAEDMGLVEIYDYVYRYASYYVHSTAAVLGDVFLGLDAKGEKAVFVRGPHIMAVDAALSMTIATFIELLKMVNEDLNASCTKEISEFEVLFSRETKGRKIGGENN